MSSSIVPSRNGAARKFLSEHAHKTWFRPDRVAACDRQSSPRFNAGKNVIILGRKPTVKSCQTIFVKEKSICECNTIGNLSNSSISQCVLGKTLNCTRQSRLGRLFGACNRHLYGGSTTSSWNSYYKKLKAKESLT